jgi:hypothetical protein
MSIVMSRRICASGRRAAGHNRPAACAPQNSDATPKTSGRESNRNDATGATKGHGASAVRCLRFLCEGENLSVAVARLYPVIVNPRIPVSGGIGMGIDDLM